MAARQGAGVDRREDAAKDERPDWCQFCGWECADPDELAIHIEDCEPFDD